VGRGGRGCPADGARGVGCVHGQAAGAQVVCVAAKPGCQPGMPAHPSPCPAALSSPQPHPRCTSHTQAVNGGPEGAQHQLAASSAHPRSHPHTCTPGCPAPTPARPHPAHPHTHTRAPTPCTPTHPHPPTLLPTPARPQVFGEVCSLVTTVLDGYNVCIMAYGQTGSGAPAHGPRALIRAHGRPRHVHGRRACAPAFLKLKASSRLTPRQPPPMGTQARHTPWRGQPTTLA